MGDLAREREFPGERRILDLANVIVVVLLRPAEELGSDGLKCRPRSLSVICVCQGEAGCACDVDVFMLSVESSGVIWEESIFLFVRSIVRSEF